MQFDRREDGSDSDFDLSILQLNIPSHHNGLKHLQIGRSLAKAATLGIVLLPFCLNASISNILNALMPLERRVRGQRQHRVHIIGSLEVAGSCQ
jgi:hypothetical protein